MAELVTLEEDGNLGKAGDQVWVDDPKDVDAKPKSAKKTAASKSSDE